MTDSLSGLVGSPVLAGQSLDGAGIDSSDVRVRKIKSITQSSNGDRREGHVFEDPGYPLEKAKREITLRYRHLRDHYDLVEELLAGPGPHDLVVWKRIHLQFAGNGWRTEFCLHHRVATHTLSPPAGFPSAKFDVEARVGLSGSPLTVLEKSSTDYDAGSPPATEAWFLDGGQKFKVGAAPDSGEVLFVRMVPILEMFEEVEVEKRYRSGSIREPRDIVLVEA